MLSLLQDGEEEILGAWLRTHLMEKQSKLTLHLVTIAENL